MNKFLFTDGTGGVEAVQSLTELESRILSSRQSGQIRLWLFSSNEWISLAEFRKQFPLPARRENPIPITGNPSAVVNQQPISRKHWFIKGLYVAGTAAIIFLISNFTKIKWEKASPVSISATRPDNVPQMDIDSLIEEIEYTRSQSLDRNTKINLRLRNTWPDRILLQLRAEREKSNSGYRFFNIDIAIDNTTGFNLDEAVVKLSVWEKGKINSTDTLLFNAIRFDKLEKRTNETRYKGDSISIAFVSIKAKAFNFCYSGATKNNSGNYNDRWFCRN
jgi:hypothetical protein